MNRKAKGPGFQMKGHTLPGIKQIKSTKIGGRAKSSAFQKETDEEFEARMKAQGTTISPTVEVKGEETSRDRLAKQAAKGRSGKVIEGRETSAKSQDYKDADKLLASKGDKEAKTRLRNRALKVSEINKMMKTQNLSQEEVDELMSQR